MSENLKGGPAHYRLSKATWDLILDEYRNGATQADQVHGATKRDCGDQIALETAKAREAAQEEAKVAKGGGRSGCAGGDGLVRAADAGV